MARTLAAGFCVSLFIRPPYGFHFVSPISKVVYPMYFIVQEHSEHIYNIQFILHCSGLYAHPFATKRANIPKDVFSVSREGCFP
ncbi:hypothetical protein RSOLAG1IB_01582 [Rhizoctonia solani AG-1 IB]|uniref:Uncharacterized protein n=1 Tax=Thanatephorus cucumeris (strain AG1-IB / isolate 7/3/14) TaxID=1108050 RepID=A0A0B7FDC5_THACB|nr:hypothetical protein RSOLAG1IB_01582 [Rhizoctonia solani AG-1 IB]